MFIYILFVNQFSTPPHCWFDLLYFRRVAEYPPDWTVAVNEGDACMHVAHDISFLVEFQDKWSKKSKDW